MTDALATGSRVLLVIALLAALVGCSINSEINPSKGMRCLHAHDEWHNGNGWLPVCDQYVPVSPMPTVTVTATETP